jgi:(p)ppGpp synthase/HD superfamily hydrolase
MAVAGIVLEANAYHHFDDIEDIAIAALLHDAIEDQGHRIKLEDIRERFGDRVQDIVRDCSDAIIEEEHQLARAEGSLHLKSQEQADRDNSRRLR